MQNYSKKTNKKEMEETMLTDFGTDDDMYSPCCFNSLAKPLGLMRYYCVKCGKIWKIQEQEGKYHKDKLNATEGK